MKGKKKEHSGKIRKIVHAKRKKSLHGEGEKGQNWDHKEATSRKNLKRCLFKNILLQTLLDNYTDMQLPRCF